MLKRVPYSRSPLLLLRYWRGTLRALRFSNRDQRLALFLSSDEIPGLLSSLAYRWAELCRPDWGWEPDLREGEW